MNVLVIEASLRSQKVPVYIEDEMRQNSFMDYAMSIIISRALPDVRDGLKPVPRRVLSPCTTRAIPQTDRLKNPPLRQRYHG